MDNVITQHITKTPGICGGQACIAGHRIRVMDVVVLHERRGMSPEEVVQQYPGISLADVYAALTYYHDNREEIEESFRKELEVAESLRHLFPSKVQEKLSAAVDSWSTRSR
jgi:uncharacterized protein (DUF433 family)